MATIAAVGANGSHLFTRTDAARTFTHLGELWSGLIDGLDPDVVDRSAVTLIGGEMVDQLSTGLGVDLPDEPTIAATLGALGATAAERVAAAEALESPNGDDVGTWLGASWLRLGEVAEQLRTAGAYAVQSGIVEQVNASGGGVPKRALDGPVEVSWRGLAGDTQGTRQHHGRPWQALCIWSADVIDALRQDGHPVAAGSVGENLTVRGLDWSAVRPGVRLTIGDTECVVSTWAAPCTKIANAFSDGDHRRLEAGTGIARAYATVVQPGTVCAGAPVEVS